MARNFAGLYRMTGSSTVNAYPLSLFCRARATVTNDNNWCVAWNEPALGDASQMIGLNSTAKGAYRRSNAGVHPSDDSCVSVASYSANTWYSIGARGVEYNDAAVFLDGVKLTRTVTVSLQQSLPSLLIGALRFGGTYYPHHGQIAMAAGWAGAQGALTDDEFMSMHKGFSPRRIRPQSLVFWLPMIRDVQELIQAIAMTDTGSTVTDQPRGYGY